MPYSATVFSVLIASPSDVNDERKAIADALHEWNSLNSQVTGHVLLPVMWESHSAPAMGDRPQEIINKQVVRDCDMLIGAFWTRLGSPTGVEESGTVEEIRSFLKQNKPVMLYYSKQQVDLDRIDTAQLEKLKQFKVSIRDKGIQADYSSPQELKQVLLRHVTIVMRDMSVAPKVDARTVRAAKASVDVDEELPVAVAKKTKRDDGIRLEDYSEKAFAIRGDSTSFMDQLRAMNGRWIPLKTGGKGWVFSKRRLEDVAKLLGVKAELVAPD
ncbi:DUF4062 domain-containing protein [Dyella acidisoli]|uniref:DUF4062 domain-containing protein n=1 Tax=Dyella acidisoli TaxID=1867834 RepID=A0ABQ5XNJ6_9GAMM|nr:DUF4062 domain-containing protein [Dyella acidisoli]GLQ92806.1 hypothetical protein GCM10007901_17570 [Dyella acidisoli]